MKRKKVLFCHKKLNDRDFLYGIFPKNGFLKNHDEFLRISGDPLNSENEPEDPTLNGANEEE